MSPASVPTHDLLGRRLTPLETKVAAIHQQLADLCATPGLPPCIAGNAAHALAATWQMMNDLDLDATPPEDAGAGA